MSWVGPALARTYARLDLAFGPHPFTSVEARRAISGLDAQPNLRIARLVAAGWLGRIGRGRFVTLGPQWAGSDREDPLRSFRVAPFYASLTTSVSGILHQFGARLRSVALFGSCARGTMGPESDLDLLLVADPVPATLQGRLDELRPIVETVRKSARPAGSPNRGSFLPQIVELGEADLAREPPLLLDLTMDARILYDPAAVLERSLSALRSKLSRLGSRRLRTPEGGEFWVLRPGARAGEVGEV